MSTPFGMTEKTWNRLLKLLVYLDERGPSPRSEVLSDLKEDGVTPNFIARMRGRGFIRTDRVDGVQIVAQGRRADMARATIERYLEFISEEQ